MPLEIAGRCHCGNLAFLLITSRAASEIRSRECDCDFCRRHGAANWSDPAGTATIRVADSSMLQKYRFGLRTADFLICRRCGCYIGAVLEHGASSWSTLNLRMSALQVPAAGASYTGEQLEARVARRKSAWTPTRIVIGA